jgi:hypothetical protein
MMAAKLEKANTPGIFKRGNRYAVMVCVRARLDRPPLDLSAYMRSSARSSAVLTAFASSGMVKLGRRRDGLARERDERGELLGDRLADRVDVGQRVEVAQQSEVHLAVIGHDRDRQRVILG